MGRGPQIVALLLVAALLGAMMIQPTRQLFEQKQRIASMADELDNTLETNRRLKNRIHRLQDPDFVEQLARQQVGLVRPGEIPYVVMPPSGEQLAKKKAKKERKEAASTPPPEPGAVEGFLRFVGFL
jgi:cell division protein FtsB